MAVAKRVPALAEMDTAAAFARGAAQGDLRVVEVAALERLKALPELAADARRGRLRELPEPGLRAERLDVTRQQSPDERANDHRLERLGAKQLRAAGELALTARWMISRAPSFASSYSAPRGSSPIPTASRPSILASTSADGGTVRLTA